MKELIIQGKTLHEWTTVFPELPSLLLAKEVFWINPELKRYQEIAGSLAIHEEELVHAIERLDRFSPYLLNVFPETKGTNGIIESPMKRIPNMKQTLQTLFQQEFEGELWLKCDHLLPISGSIKARGGIYEVLKHAEDLAFKNGMLSRDDDYSILSSDRFRSFFSSYTISVGSTGNLGLSIGIMGSKLGFKVTVHMSSEAKIWKKDLLRSLGVNVIEYDTDYTNAVESGREQAKDDPKCYFIDDENSKDLFLGYAVAADRLGRQLSDNGLKVDADHPLFVYLPCGVGGGPGGITYGLKTVFGDHVHCFFAEPTEAPCMLLGLGTKLHDKVSVQQLGISNKTAADGLAVGRSSKFVSETMNQLLSGSYTVTDDHLLLVLNQFWTKEGISLEPSATAGAFGPVQLYQTEAGKEYMKKQGLYNKMESATHIVWATGGSMVPKDVFKEYLAIAQKISKD